MRVEGLDDARWVLMDYGDFLVHVFLDEARQFYDLEHLWLDAPRIDWTGVRPHLIAPARSGQRGLGQVGGPAHRPGHLGAAGRRHLEGPVVDPEDDAP